MELKFRPATKEELDEIDFKKSQGNYQTSMAGEFFVLHQLFKHGYTASLTLGNAKGVDILVSTRNGKMYRIEVKTSSKENKTGINNLFGETILWPMNVKDADKTDADLYYIFVALRGENELPRCFIVKAKEVAEYLKYEYKYWKDAIRNKPVRDTVRRTFRIGLNGNSRGLPIQNHENKWDILPK